MGWGVRGEGKETPPVGVVSLRAAGCVRWVGSEEAVPRRFASEETRPDGARPDWADQEAFRGEL